MVHFEHGKCHTVNVGRRDQEKVYSMSPGCTSTPENDHLSVGYPYDSNMESNVITILGTQVANVTHVTQASNQNPTTAYDSKTTSDPSSNDGLMNNWKSGIYFYAVSSIALFLSIGSFFYIVWRKGRRRRMTSFHLHGHDNNHQRHVPEFEMTNNREDTTTPQISSQLPSQAINTHPSLIPSHLDTVQRNIAQQPRDQCPTLPPRIRYGGSNETTSVQCHLLADRESGANTLPSVTGRKKEGKLHPTKCDPEEFIPTTVQNNDCKAIAAGSPDSTTNFENIYNTVDDVQCDLGGGAAAVDIHNVKESPLSSPCSFSANCEDPISDLGPTGNDQEEQLNIELHNESSTPTSSENIESLYAKPNKNPNTSDLSSPAINRTSLREGDSGNHQISVHPSDYEELRQ